MAIGRRCDPQTRQARRAGRAAGRCRRSSRSGARDNGARRRPDRRHGARSSRSRSAAQPLALTNPRAAHRSVSGMNASGCAAAFQRDDLCLAGSCSASRKGRHARARHQSGPIDAGGHRARLRKRLFEGGPKALLDHELVEYLLALAIPRRDTKTQAKRLIAQFGGIGPLLSARCRNAAPRRAERERRSPRSRSPKRPRCGCSRPGSRAGRCCRAGRRSAIISRRRWPIRRSRKSACCSSTPRTC